MISKKRFYESVSEDMNDLQALFEKAFADQTEFVIASMPYVVPLELNVGFGLVLNDQPYMPANKRSSESESDDMPVGSEEDDAESVRSFGLFIKFAFGFMLGEEEDTRTLVQTLVPVESPKQFLKHLFDNKNMLLDIVMEAVKDGASGGRVQ